MFAHFLIAVDEITDRYSNGLPKTILSYKITSNKLILDRERGFYSNGEMKYDKRYRNGEVYSSRSWVKVNLREYYYPLDKLINNPRVYVYENQDGELMDIQKLETTIEENGDTILVSTFYSDLYDKGSIWKERCTLEGIEHISGPTYQMVDSLIFQYHQDIGESSHASFNRDNVDYTIFWERILKGTLESNSTEIWDYDDSRVITSEAIIFKDIFSDGKEDIYSRTLQYQKGIGRVSLVDEYQTLKLVYIFSLDDFEYFKDDW